MKRKLISYLSCIIIISNALYAHCQVPCGIYDDALRIVQTKEDVNTILKAMNQGMRSDEPARRERIEDDLKKAEGLKAEAEAALAEYQAVIAQATQKAQDALRAAAHEASDDAARQREALSVRLTAEGDAAQARIEAESRRVIDDIGVIASELAQSAARRLAGADISPEEAVAAVAAAQREAG